MGVDTLPAQDQAPAESEATAQAQRTTDQLFRWSGYVDVGDGAEDCDERLSGDCKDSKHFHSWVCLPNAFQIDDIREKGRAAKARKVRSMKDAGDPANGRAASDSYEILENDLTYIAGGDLKVIHQEIAKKNVQSDYRLIVAELYEREEFASYEQDLEELNRLKEMPEDDRDAETFEQVQNSVMLFGAAFDKEVTERTAREIEGIERLSDEAVMDIVRQNRIEAAGEQAFLRDYYLWVMFIGAREPDMTVFPEKRKFATIQKLKNTAPEIAKALRLKITELENAFGDKGGGSGN